MIKIHNYRRNMEKIKHRAHLVQDWNPHIKSMANALLLADDLIHQDTRYIERHDWETWGKIKYKFLQEHRKTYGDQITCMYCGKKIRGSSGKKQITIDHFFPSFLPDISRFDTRFFVISCSKCNNKKGQDTIPLTKLSFAPKDFVERLRQSIEQEFGVDYVSKRSVQTVRRKVTNADRVNVR
jgi:5-methylcytosine-specific restriction endonuclease McrA